MVMLGQIGVTLSLRWLLSDWAGVSFGHGFSEGDKPPFVNVTLLDEAARKRYWDEF